MSSAGVNTMHACLSGQVCDDLLRKELGFNGVVMSECLEMDALAQNIGVAGGTVMALNAGCDLILCCRLFPAQKEALTGLKLGLENETITKERVYQSLERVLKMKSKCTSWEKALNPGGMDMLVSLQEAHSELSTKAYTSSLTIVKDTDRLLPISTMIEPDEELLILSPLVKPLAASAAAQELAGSAPDATAEAPSAYHSGPSNSILSGETMFRELGRLIARRRNGRVMHTSYTASGVRAMHENLINRAGAVLIITGDSNRHLYQHGFTKHVGMICKSQYSQGGEPREKPLIVVSVSSPFDFVLDQAIGTYICTYDFTETALRTLVDVLFDEVRPTGTLPGSILQKQKSQKSNRSTNNWLVENYNEERDSHALEALLEAVANQTPVNQKSPLSGCKAKSFLVDDPAVEEQHFVVRNSGTKAIYGFCATYFFQSTGTGVVAAIMVDPANRKLSIGHSLHARAIKHLTKKEGIKRFQLGSRLPSIYLGIPNVNNVERKRLRRWFAGMGWRRAMSRPVCSMLIADLSTWKEAEPITKSLQHAEVTFDLVHGWDYAESILEHVKTSSRQGVMEMYKLALADQEGAGVIRATRPRDGIILGTVVLYTTNSVLDQAVPALSASSEAAGGISSPVISPSAGEFSTLLQGLILLGIRSLRGQQANAVLMDCVSLPLQEAGLGWLLTRD